MSHQNIYSTLFRRRNVFVFLLFGSLLLTCTMCSFFNLSPMDHVYRAIHLRQHEVPFPTSSDRLMGPLFTQRIPDSEFYIPNYTMPPKTRVTDARRCVFYIENLQDSYNLCDKIHVIIEARDHFNYQKRKGGDYFRAKVYSITSLASESTDGEIVDHENGTYSAFFTLRWSGPTYIEVKLIHSSEAITAINRVQAIYPVRMAYDGKFQIGDIIHTMRCHVELSSTKELCNYTDVRTGEPWFCEKPIDLPCTALMLHRGNLNKGRIDTLSKFTSEERLFFRPKTIIGAIKIFVNTSDEKTLCEESPTICQPILHSAKADQQLASGFYFNDSWHSNDCRLQNIDVQSISTSKCLTNKQFYFYGDSTVRQWFEYLVQYLPDTSQIDIPGVNAKGGPLIAKSEKYNIKLFYRHHAYPIRNSWMRVEDIKWTANEIDQINADGNTVICINMFAHFVPTSIDVYRRRLLTIKSALLRLFKRSPKTLVFFKSANTRDYHGPEGSVNYGDWLALQLDQEMRLVMDCVPNLTIIDVWDMTNCHRTGEVIHPHQLVIREEINVLLSFICRPT
ncbi:NXPE family member 3-like [Anneissia japonica]|uniref:NXPE family member 3-like n=1 Tax=Anneissia japonica TaxID=1529436 RepID=UPI0014256932|nr:NXPE family member 3-like [Anneissia japonica]